LVSDTLRGVSTAAALSDILQPAVPISQSVSPLYLVCLEDGKKVTVLERYLSASYGMTPE
jgi:predicted transcriptional regulator